MIEINLLPHELTVKQKKMVIEPNCLLYLIPLVFGILVCIHLYLAAINIIKSAQLGTLNKKYKSLEPQRKEVENFKKEYTITSEDAREIQHLTEQRISWSEKLNKLSLDLPSGIWFNEISLNNKDFVLNGSVISLQKEEITLINKFIDNLKNDVSFFKDFQTLELSSVQRRVIAGYDIVDFILAGTLKAR